MIVLKVMVDEDKELGKEKELGNIHDQGEFFFLFLRSCGHR